MWDGKPHWAYNTKFMNLVDERSAIEWTPNTIFSEVTITGDNAAIQLKSNTPNLKTFEMKESEGESWQSIADLVNVQLTKDKNEFIFRTVNLAGVTGPEHKVAIAILESR